MFLNNITGVIISPPAGIGKHQNDNVRSNSDDIIEQEDSFDTLLGPKEIDFNEV